MLGLEKPEEYTGHCLRRTGATILADKGASGQALRHKLNQRSEKAVNEYISSSKAVQRRNAMMLSGFEETPVNSLPKEASENSIASLIEPSNEVSENDIAPLIEPTTSSVSNKPSKEIVKSSVSEDPMKNINEALSIFNRSGGGNIFAGCTFNFK